MMNSGLLRLLLLSVFLLNDGLAEEIDKIEKEKRHIVSRMYQATYGILQICPDNEINSFKKIITNFEETYPEFTKLLRESPYHQYAVDNFADDIANERKKSQSDESRMRQCLFGKYLIQSHISDPSGPKAVDDMLEKLQKQ